MQKKKLEEVFCDYFKEWFAFDRSNTIRKVTFPGKYNFLKQSGGESKPGHEKYQATVGRPPYFIPFEVETLLTIDDVYDIADHFVIIKYALQTRMEEFKGMDAKSIPIDIEEIAKLVDTEALKEEEKKAFNAASNRIKQARLWSKANDMLDKAAEQYEKKKAGQADASSSTYIITPGNPGMKYIFENQKVSVYMPDKGGIVYENEPSPYTSSTKNDHEKITIPDGGDFPTGKIIIPPVGYTIIRDLKDEVITGEEVEFTFPWVKKL